jgi:PEP-CTERM motif
MRNTLRLAAAIFTLGFAGPASAAVTLFTTQASFQAALTGSFTLVNLDAAPLSAFPSGYAVEDAGPAAAFAALGIDFVGFNANVFAGQNGQTPTNRDRLIENGTGNGGTITINFLTPVNGIGGLSNILLDGDGGFIRAFSGQNLGGTLIGSVGFGRNAQIAGAENGFGGLVSTDLISSVQFTCTHNADLRCGVYDIQFGTVGANNVIPEPRSWAMLIAGLGLVGWSLRRRRRPTSVPSLDQT